MLWRKRELQRLHEENQSLGARVERLEGDRDAWLDVAGHPSSDHLDFVFVVTYGRSGSTLLMGLLNALPGYHLRGENAGVVHELFEYHSRVKKFRDANAKGEHLGPQHPWYGIDEYPEQVALARMRQLVIDTLLRPRAGTRVTGFKEIRWWRGKPVKYLDFIEELFPGARFVLNTRNLTDVAQSSWYRRNPDALEELEKLDRRLTRAIATRGDRAYHVHYDDYVRDHSLIAGLYDWLGEPFDEELVDRVFDTRFSSSRHWKPSS